jgi:hypothetical protein|tara:strand:- start:7 stop:207 length:201 start_codon:yes stop_codon:yes gene_type:complete
MKTFMFLTKKNVWREMKEDDFETKVKDGIPVGVLHALKEGNKVQAFKAIKNLDAIPEGVETSRKAA